MQLKRIILIFCLAFFTFQSFAQKDSVKVKEVETKVKKEEIRSNRIYNPLSPSKAAFYSAIFPGGGQIYNRKYWKAPIVWAALGTSIYFYLDNNSEYKRYRTAFKQREYGLQDEFTLDDGTVILSDAGLERAQKVLRDNRDLAILSTVIIYVLQIVEASVNAHLLQFDDSKNLSVKPIIIPDPIRVENPTFGLNITLNF